MASKSVIFQNLESFPSPQYPLREIVQRTLWEWVERLLVCHSPRWAYGWRRMWINLFGGRVHRTACVRHRVRILHPWLLSVGKHSWIGEGTTLYNTGLLTIGEHALISQDVYVCGGTHDHRQRDLPLRRTPVTIGSGVWICAQAAVGPEVTVGDNSIIGLRAVVVASVAPGSIVAGNPARVIGHRLEFENVAARGAR